MTDLRKAAEMALEALKGIHIGNMTPMAENNWNKAIETLCTSLAQPEQETDYGEGFEEGYKAALAQPEQDPESWMGITDNPYCDDADCNDSNGRAMRWHKKLLYLRKQEHTAPPSKEWVGLTDAEVSEAAIKCVKSGQSVNAAIRDIEAALRSKNNGN